MKTILFVLLAWLPIATHAADIWNPSIPKQGEPVLYSLTDYPFREWCRKSTNTYPWFVIKTNGWYIDWDCERRPITHLVVHHTGGPGTETPERISEAVKARVYGSNPNYYSVFRDPKYNTPYVNGLPIHSGHIIDGKETFTAYHYLIYPDGRILITLVPHRQKERQYFVDMIGWGAGVWNINCASVQVALVGTWSKKEPPSPEAIESLKKIIRYYRERVPGLAVVGHYEVRPKPTECPGDWWPEWIQKNR